MKESKILKVVGVALIIILVIQLILPNTVVRAEYTAGVQEEVEFTDLQLYQRVIKELNKQGIACTPFAYIPENPVYKLEMALRDIEKVTELDLSNENENIVGNSFDIGYSDIAEEDSKKILSNYSDFQNYLNSYQNGRDKIETILNAYKENFFNNKSLAVLYVTTNSVSNKVNYNGATIQDNTITINYSIEIANAGLDAVGGHLIIAEVDKNITNVLGEELDKTEDYIETEKITDLNGIEKFTNLKKLNLANNKISSVYNLEDMDNLEFVNLKGNCLASLNGLGGLMSRQGQLAVDFLDLRDNYVEENYVGFEEIEQSPFITFWLELEDSIIISNKSDYWMLGEPEYELGGSAIGLSKDKTKIYLDTSTVGTHTAIVKIKNGLREGTTFKYNYTVSQNVFREDPNYKPTIIEDEIVIYNIPSETKASDFKANLKEDNMVIEEDNSAIDNNEIIKTGMKIEKDNITYTLVVKGDISKTGTNDITDLLRLKAHIVKDEELSGIALKAADITDRGKIDITDLLRLKEIVVNN